MYRVPAFNCCRKNVSVLPHGQIASLIKSTNARARCSESAALLSASVSLVSAISIFSSLRWLGARRRVQRRFERRRTPIFTQRFGVRTPMRDNNPIENSGWFFDANKAADERREKRHYRHYPSFTTNDVLDAALQCNFPWPNACADFVSKISRVKEPLRPSARMVFCFKGRATAPGPCNAQEVARWATAYILHC